MNFQQLLASYTYFGNTAWDYTLALFVLIVAWVFLKLFQLVILGSLARLAKKTKNDLDDIFVGILKDIKPLFYFTISLYLSLQYLVLPKIITDIVYVLLVVVVVYQAVHLLINLLDNYVQKYLENRGNGSTKSIMKILKFFIKIGLWVVVLIMILSNLGINVTSLVASLGIGGIAVALAVQNVLSDVFSAFSIYIDRPFEVGDYIQVGTDKGTVEKIGLKSTRLKTLTGEELVISNNELTSARVQNFRRMIKRRDTFSLGVVYETPHDKLEKIPEIISNIFKTIKDVELFRCHFVSYGDFSLNFDVTFYTNNPDYDIYLDRKQELNLKIFEAFQKEGIEFAYPTQLVHLKK